MITLPKLIKQSREFTDSTSQCFVFQDNDGIKHNVDVVFKSEEILITLRGEPPTPPEPITLEQLQQMDGEPVWCTGIGKYDYTFGWALLNKDEECAYANDGDIWDYDEYDKTWLAYTHKPKEESPI